MNCESNQCCAVIHNNQRCPNMAQIHASHCLEHIQTATKLYGKYKKICDTAYSLDINKQISDMQAKFKHVYDCYIWLNRAFHARLKHRRYAFVPECYDDGHNQQFKFITDKLKQCEERLTEIYKLHEKMNAMEHIDIYDIQEDTHDKQLIKHDTIDSIPTDIILKKKKRDNNEKEENRLIERYYNENMERLEKRSKINHMCLNIIKSLVEPKIIIDTSTVFEICVLMHHLTVELHRIGYLNDNYVPEKCQDCNCGNYVTYDVRLTCGCVFRNDTVEKYFNIMSDKTIKYFCEIMLVHKEKLIPLVDDLLKLYASYKERLIGDMKVTIKWSKKLDRLKMKPCFFPEPEKYSKILSEMRMRKKNYIHKYGKYYDNDDSDDSE